MTEPNFSDEQDEIICFLVNKLGFMEETFKIIQQKFKDKSSNEIKNRYITHIQNNNKFIWTKEEDLCLVSMLECSRRYEEIQKIINKSITSLKNRYKVLREFNYLLVDYDFKINRLSNDAEEFPGI